MKLGVLLVSLGGINILYCLFYGGANLGMYLLWFSMLGFGIFRIVQTIRRKQKEA